MIRNRIFLSSFCSISFLLCSIKQKKRNVKKIKRKCCWCLDRCSRKVAQLLPDSYSRDRKKKERPCIKNRFETETERDRRGQSVQVKTMMMMMMMMIVAICCLDQRIRNFQTKKNDRMSRSNSIMGYSIN